MRWIVATFIIWLLVSKQWTKFWALATTSAADLSPQGGNQATGGNVVKLPVIRLKPPVM